MRVLAYTALPSRQLSKLVSMLTVTVVNVSVSSVNCGLRVSTQQHVRTVFLTANRKMCCWNVRTLIRCLSPVALAATVCIPMRLTATSAGWTRRCIATITLRRSKLDRLIGHHIADEQVSDILRRLGCEVTEGQDEWKAIFPPLSICGN